MNHPLNNVRWIDVAETLLITLNKLNEYLDIKIQQAKDEADRG